MTRICAPQNITCRIDGLIFDLLPQYPAAVILIALLAAAGIANLFHRRIGA